MNQKLIGIFIILLGINCASMSQATKEELDSLNKIVEIPGQKKDVIFTKSLEWFARNYGSSKEVLELQDKSTGKIIGKAIVSHMVLNMQPISLNHTIVLNIKDSKFKISYETCYASGVTQYGPFKRSELSQSEFLTLKDSFTNISNSLSEYITTGSKKDDF